MENKVFAQLGIVQAALPVLAVRASITLITAVSAQAALPGTVGLAAINGALEAAVKPLAAELAPRGSSRRHGGTVSATPAATRSSRTREKPSRWAASGRPTNSAIS
jgi:enoyl-[acyl-carrier-protein] reductase (NADH)